MVVKIRPEAAGTFRTQVFRGVAWKVVSQIVMQATRIVVVLVLARMLTPSDFGLVAMALVFTGLVMVFSDLGLASALIRRPSLTEADCSTAFWTSLAAGLLFAVVGVGVSGFIADFYGEPDVRPILAILSVVFVIGALATTQSALLIRDMNFKVLELRVMGGVLVGAAAGIAVAASGGGAWAIVSQQLVTAGVSTTLLWVLSPWRPRFMFSRQSFRDLTGFGANIFGTHLLFYANRNADNLLIGRYLGPAALGAYAIAYNLMLYPIVRIAGPIRDVLFPAFSKIQDDPARSAKIWLRVNKIVAAIALPAMLGLIVIAPDFVPVVLGERWDDAVPVLQILAWVGILQALQRLNGSVLMARNHPNFVFRFAILAFVASIASFVVGLRWGIVGVAAAYAVANTLIQPVFSWVTARCVDLRLTDVLRNLSGVTQAAVIMAGIVIALRYVLVDVGVPASGRLVAEIAVGGSTYLVCCLWRAPDVLTDIRTMRRKREPASEPVTQAADP